MTYSYLFAKYQFAKKVLPLLIFLIAFSSALFWTVSPVLAHDEHDDVTHTEELVSWAGLIIVGVAVVVRVYLSKDADDPNDTGSTPNSEQ